MITPIMNAGSVANGDCQAQGLDLTTFHVCAIHACARKKWLLRQEMDRNGDDKVDVGELRDALERLGLPSTPE
jgi:hypothetical protein